MNDEPTPTPEYHEDHAPPAPAAVPTYQAKLAELRRIVDKADVKESEIHEYMVQNPEVLPTPQLLNHGLQWGAVISKFEIDRNQVPDFTYLTKSSGEWRVVFVELERPQKELWVHKPHIDFSAATSQAISQIEEWKSTLEFNKDQVRRKLDPLLRPEMLSRMPVSFHFVLVIGRNPHDYYPSPLHSGRVQRLKNENNITFCTYDTLFRMAPNSGMGQKKNVLIQRGEGFEFKTVQKEMGMFTYMTAFELSVPKEHEQFFIEHGYNLDAWRRGEPLMLNYKEPDGPDGANFSRIFEETAERVRQSKNQ